MSKKELVLPFDGDFINVYLNINIWTGQTRLSESDIRLGDGGSLPPAHFASLGSKKLIDPNNLKIFHNLKRKAQSAILAHGIRFLEHYAIPFHKEEEVFKLLEEIESEFIYERNKFVNNLDSSIQSWINENPEWEMSIRSVQLNPQKIEGRLNFEFLTYRVQAT